MSSTVGLILIFFALCFLVLLVYVLVVWGYYWSGRNKPPEDKNKKRSE